VAPTQPSNEACCASVLLAGVEAAVDLQQQLDDEMEQHKRRRSIVLARWRQHSLVTKHAVHRCTRTLLLAGIEAAVDLQQQLDDEMEQHTRRRSIVLARWCQRSLVTKHVVHYTRTLLLAGVEAAVNLEQ